MATSYTDQFFAVDPGSPPPVGTQVDVVFATLFDSDDNDLIEAPTADTVNGQGVSSSWPGDTLTIERPDGTQVTYTGTTFYLDDGSRFFTPTDGQILESGTFVSSSFVLTNGPLDVRDLGAPCFTPGTLIQTPDGPVAVEHLQAGDMITTADAGPVPVIAAMERSLSAAALTLNPRRRPVRIAAGALAPGLPSRDLIVSPQHRILLRSPVIARMFGVAEVLAPAAHLTDAPGITRLGADAVTYIHLVTAQHHVVRAEGCETETLLLGPVAVAQFGRRSYMQLLDKLAPGGTLPKLPARLLVRGPRVRWAVRRHLQNGKPLVSDAPCRTAEESLLWQPAAVPIAV